MLTLTELQHTAFLCCMPLTPPHPTPCAGGAGGRYTWGKLGEIYDDDGRPKDTKDPNYDSEEVSSVIGASLT